ncbi:transposase [Thermocatellispora tengchongensis]|uniref:Transposase n=1 Tax=Thermocatellispora tengchongensis TaxID=1073253 RepID=A0A840PJL5_9ACTN|nr:helix-turn-helix domain-containing protein [Thermocatellispora tengchongensis]MBB5136255.1 transposase [Thermocatellispora tengchongensis]
MPDRTRRRHAQIHDLLDRGHSLKAIARDLGLARNTVRRFARATDPEELLVNDGTGQRPKMLDAFEPYLRERWNNGCTNAQQLYRELRVPGHRGGPTFLRQYLRPWRDGLPRHQPPPRPPSVRRAAGWLLRDPAGLDNDERRQLDALTASCPPWPPFATTSAISPG